MKNTGSDSRDFLMENVISFIKIVTSVVEVEFIPSCYLAR